jgi:hypothetical protein
MRKTSALGVFLAAFVSLSSAVPVITLDLVQSRVTPNNVHEGKYGVGCAKNPALCRAPAKESKFIHTCPAAGSTQETCPLPSAKAYDHTDGDLSKHVVFKTYLVNDNGAPVVAAAACENKNCINYSKRSEWVTMFDVKDKSGNAAETVIFATVLNDIVAPILSPKGPFRAEASCVGKIVLPTATAVDNVDKAVKVQTVPQSVPLNKLVTSKAFWKACDSAGMFGAGGHNNCVSKEFDFTVSDTTKPVITTVRESSLIECARGKKASPHLHSRFAPKCIDSFDGVLECTTTQDIHHPLSDKGTTTFTWNAVDKSGNKAAKVSRVTVVDTTPPSLQISDAGHKNLKRNINGKYKLVYKGKAVSFSRTVLRDMGYDWENNALLTHRMGDKVEAEMVKELLTPGRGYKCSDSCAAAATATVHINHKDHHTALACGQTNSRNKVNYDHFKKGTYTLRYTCTDAVGLSVVKCRTIKNVQVGRVALDVFVAVPAKINTLDIKGAMVGFFKDPSYKKYGINDKSIFAKMGREVPAPTPAPGKEDARRLIEGGRRKVPAPTPAPAPMMFRLDVFRINVPPPKLAAVYKILVGCEYEAYLAARLKLKCRLANPDPTFKCIEVKEIVMESADLATPLIVVRGEKIIAVEGLSSYTDAGAYCIKPCKEHDDIMMCPGRLPLGNSIMKVKPSSLCDPKTADSADDTTFEKDTTKTETSAELSKTGGVDTKKLGEYLIEYECSYSVDGTKYSALTKMRAVKVVDTNRPTCSLLHSTITREASFPFAPQSAVCKDGFDGKVNTIPTGTYDVEKTGKYVLTYSAKDTSGNVAPKVRQTIFIKDTLKPVISLGYGGKQLHRTTATDKGVNGQANSVGKQYTKSKSHKKCSMEKHERMFRVEGKDEDSCYKVCAETTGCNHFSVATAGSFKGVCMGCKTGVWVSHDDFHAYDMGVFHLAHYGKKCPYASQQRLFKIDSGTTLASCKEACSKHSECNRYSYGTKDGAFSGMCMGCKGTDWEDHAGFAAFSTLNTAV